MTSHIDQLQEWWDEAEDAPANPGDRIIERHVPGDNDEDTYYTIGTHRQGVRGLSGKSGTRILSRAPKPRPAWHDAVAVIAAHVEDPGHKRQVFTRTPSKATAWESPYFYAADSDLVDPVPLIEARVTDEQVGRVGDMLGAYYGAAGDKIILDVLHAALGLDPDKENA